MRWYIVSNNKEHGPFSLDQLRTLFSQNKIDSSHKARREGTHKLIAAHQLKALLTKEQGGIGNEPEMHVVSTNSVEPIPLPPIASAAASTPHSRKSNSAAWGCGYAILFVVLVVSLTFLYFVGKATKETKEARENVPTKTIGEQLVELNHKIDEWKSLRSKISERITSLGQDRSSLVFQLRQMGASASDQQSSDPKASILLHELRDVLKQNLAFEKKLGDFDLAIFKSESRVRTIERRMAAQDLAGTDDELAALVRSMMEMDVNLEAESKDEVPLELDDVLKKALEYPIGVKPPAEVKPSSDYTPFQADSIWVENDLKLTVIEQRGETFRAIFESKEWSRMVKGAIGAGKVTWLAKDVQPIKGGVGGDNFGTVSKDEKGYRIDFMWKQPNGKSGTYCLRLVERDSSSFLRQPFAQSASIASDSVGNTTIQSQLQGRWQCVAEYGMSEAQLHDMNKQLEVDGDKFVISRKQKGELGVYDGRFRMSDSNEFDWSGTGPSGTRIKLVGIYSWDRTTLKICYRVADQEANAPRAKWSDLGNKGIVCVSFIRASNEPSSPTVNSSVTSLKKIAFEGWEIYDLQFRGTYGKDNINIVSDGEVEFNVGMREIALLSKQVFKNGVLTLEFQTDSQGAPMIGISAKVKNRNGKDFFDRYPFCIENKLNGPVGLIVLPRLDYQFKLASDQSFDSADRRKVLPLTQDGVLKKSDWNTMEIRFDGTDYLLSMNGRIVNRLNDAEPISGNIVIWPGQSKLKVRNVKLRSSEGESKLTFDSLR